MGVSCDKAVLTLKGYVASVAGCTSYRRSYNAVMRGDDGCADGYGNVNAGVEFFYTGERVGTPTITARDIG
jgi:hypothetical protein